MRSIETDLTASVPCPCCSDDMSPALVACWDCYRLCDRLTPGTYPDGFGGTFTLSRADVDRWDGHRDDRVGL